MTTIKVGFTGTRRGMTGSQWASLTALLKAFCQRYDRVEFHHGQCIGADEEAASIAKELGCWIVSHPPTNQKAISNFAFDEARAPRPYLQRNNGIVNEADVVLAAPGEIEEQLRSGTWATIRYARRSGKPAEILYPLPGEVRHAITEIQPQWPLPGIESRVIDRRLGPS